MPEQTTANISHLDKKLASVFLIGLDVERPGWGEGYLLQDDEGRWWRLSIDLEASTPLPRVIKTRTQAIAFIKEADLWYRCGVDVGEANAKAELRKWLKSS
ncbi:hypothetical protein FHR99_003184 [Litorivivens lipolytica]|uniref:Uncharacterized protein n=1 Tax=Litorivivens lipolytica TaxID=1524264 RepID=A0A7W4W7N5_9GAMM|nr:hypothetical protein [Litorivivens lipolytica]MBB3048910.1 hypothetical protein [Litorivivens lipolytica]